MVRLVLNLSLYGLKTAGDMCHDAFKQRILCQGWEDVSSDDWADLYYHPKYHAFPGKYVDDFKLVAKVEHHEELWKGLSSFIKFEADESPAERLLGTDLETFETTTEHVRVLLEMHPTHDR